MQDVTRLQRLCGSLKRTIVWKKSSFHPSERYQLRLKHCSLESIVCGDTRCSSQVLPTGSPPLAVGHAAASHLDGASDVTHAANVDKERRRNSKTNDSCHKACWRQKFVLSGSRKQPAPGK